MICHVLAQLHARVEKPDAVAHSTLNALHRFRPFLDACEGLGLPLSLDLVDLARLLHLFDLGVDVIQGITLANVPDEF